MLSLSTFSFCDFLVQNVMKWSLSDRPFNLQRGGGMVSCFVQNFFFGQHESSNIDFFCRAESEILFVDINIRLYD
jgi:hypothetical protein